MWEFGNNNYLTKMLSPYGIELFLRLVFAHLLADFVCQPDSWVNDRSGRGWRSRSLVYHAVVTGVLALLSVNLWNIMLILKDPAALPGLISQLWLPLVSAFVLITVSHFAIDGSKPYLKAFFQKRASNTGDQKGEDDEPACVLIIDQAIHLAVLLFVLMVILYPQASLLYPSGDPVGIVKIWIVLIAYLLILWPSGVLISRITQTWRAGKGTTEVQTALRFDYDSSHQEREICTRFGKPQEADALDKAGRWIGYLERLLIVTFILAGDYTAIGFLAAAKGLFRFNDPKRAEYVIVGTLLSFAIAVLIGAAVRCLLGLSGTGTMDQCLSELVQIF